MYLKHSSDYIDSKYIWVHWFSSLGSSDFAEIPLLALIALHRERKRCGQVEHSSCYSQSEVVYSYQVLDLQLQWFFWPKKTFFGGFSHYHSNHLAKFFAHVLSWVKTYHHAEFQRNLPTCWAGMMVKKYRLTDRQTDRQTDR